jgi:hypothetical protein
MEPFQDLPRILEERPFAGIIQPMVEPLAVPGSHSGAIYTAHGQDGRKYKLRAFPDEGKAAYIERNILKAPQVLPALAGRDGRYLLMEYLEGWRQAAKKDLLMHARTLGRMCGTVHALNDPGSHDCRGSFRRHLDAAYAAGALDDLLVLQARAAYDDLIQRLGIRVVLELADTNPGNFMLAPDGRMLYVDEEGLHHREKGLGFGKILKRMKRDEQWTAFMQGYAEAADAGFFTPDYRTYVLLVETVRSIDFKVTNRLYLGKVPGELEALRTLVQA